MTNQNKIMLYFQQITATEEVIFFELTKNHLMQWLENNLWYNW